MKSNSILPTLLVISIFLFSTCARQTAPTGGPKDTIPPHLVYSIPKQNQLNYDAQIIELAFDEFIALDNPKQKIIITPDVGNNYDIKARKKTVTITFESPLQDSTTYSINFLESIKDITEKNPANNLKLAFSTGTYIDSLSMSGNVLDAQTLKEIKNATVALYASDTFSIFRHRPNYLTKTDEKGNYSLENLKTGRYFIYAFNDANKNSIVDSKSESYGFHPESIELNADENVDPITLFKLDTRPFKLTNARPYNTYFNIRFSKGIKTYSLETEELDTLVSLTDNTSSNIKVYKTFTQDSLLITLKAEDSLRQTIDTTLYVKFSSRNQTPEPFELKLSQWRVLREQALIEGQISFSKPLSSINLDSIYYEIDSLNRITFSSIDVSTTPIPNQIKIQKRFDKNLLPQPSNSTLPNQRSQPTQNQALQNQLLLRPGAFISIEYDTSSTMAESLKPLGIEDTGIIIVNIQTQEPYYVLQLLDKSNNIIQSVRNTSAVSFKYIKPGDYLLRLIIDRDNSGNWTPGNIIQRTPTEETIFYQSEKKNQVINLKANWELGPLLISY